MFKSSSKKILILWIVFLSCHDIRSQELCKYANCLSCAQSTECKWSSGSCIKGEAQENKYLNSQSCSFLTPQENQQIYCGKTLFYSDDKEISVIELPSNNGVFGAADLYCKYKYTNKDLNNIFEFKANNRYEIDMFIFYTFTNSTQQYAFINQQSYLTSMSDLNYVEVFFYLSSQYKETPVYLEIRNMGNSIKKNDMNAFVIIGIVMVSILILSVFGFLFSKHISQSELLRLFQNRRGNTEMNEEEWKNKNIQLINDLFSNELRAKSYSRELERNGITCTICLENYDDKSQVVLTPCLHLFHFDCLRNWFHKNELKEKCPNCNCNLLELHATKWKEKEQTEQSSAQVNHVVSPMRIPPEEMVLQPDNVSNTIQNTNSPIIIQITQTSSIEVRSSKQEDNAVVKNTTINERNHNLDSQTKLGETNQNFDPEQMNEEDRNINMFIGNKIGHNNNIEVAAN